MGSRVLTMLGPDADQNYTAHMTGLDVTIHALEAAKVIVDKASSS